MATPNNKYRRRHMSEINVVPYIDVMLVLLVIFMITAPLLTQGVHVDLPQADAEQMDTEDREPVVVTVDAEGRYYVDIGDDDDEEPVDAKTLAARIAAVMRQSPETQILVRGDEHVSYGRVVEVMTVLQQAGVPSVGLMTRPPEQPET